MNRTTDILSRNIRMIAAGKNISISEVAKLVEMEPHRFYRRMNGRPGFQVAEIVDIAEALDLPVSDLLRGIEGLPVRSDSVARGVVG